MRVAVIQLTSTPDKPRNLEAATKYLRAAAADGARLAVLPEMFNVLGDADTLRAGAEPLDGPTISSMRDLARQLDIWLVAGSICERVPGRDKHCNTSCLLDPKGAIQATYRKIHLFDCDVPGAAYHESSITLPGQEIVVADLKELRLGLSICYDLRFPELFRIQALQGAGTIAIPSAFTERTGRDHWEVLLRARASAYQVYTAAANQVRPSTPRLKCFGRTMSVDPWRPIPAQAPDGECHITADIDPGSQQAIRTQLPSLSNRRPE